MCHAHCILVFVLPNVSGCLNIVSFGIADVLFSGPQVTHADFKKAKEKVMYKKKEGVPDGLYM